MRYKMMFILSMFLFGTMGVFVRNVDMPASELALLRGLIGSAFLAGGMILTRQRISWPAVKRNFSVLSASGVILGFNWIFLFQAYHYTTLPNAVLSYYFAPVIVLLLSPLVLKERLSGGKVACIGAAVVGMLMVIGNSGEAAGHYSHGVGIAYGLAAAACYAAMVLLNKFIRGIKGLDATVFQLVLATFVLVPYVYLTEGPSMLNIQVEAVPTILIIGIVHTGIAFYLFFSAMGHLKAQTVAALCYTDPLTTILISSFVLLEPLAILQMVGAALLLGATFVGDRLTETVE